MQDHFADRNEFIEHVFAELQLIEQVILDRSPGRSGRYIDGGDWFIQPGFALACLKKRLRQPSHQPILAGVSIKGLGRQLRSYLRNGTYLFDSCAAVVNVRPRVHNFVIRSFYPYESQPASVKASSSINKRLVEEVENRRIVEEIDHLRVPKIIAKDFSARCPFLVEEFITGRLAFRRSDHALLSQTLLPSLRRHYESFGVSYAPIESFLGSDIHERVEQTAALVPWNKQWQDRQQFLTVVGRLAACEKQMTLSYCHGDLSVAHVVVSDDERILLLDWESAGVQPIAHDLSKLESSCRVNRIKLYSDCENLLNEISTSVRGIDIISPTEQMFLASLQRIVAWGSKYQTLYRNQGKDPTAQLKLAFANANEMLNHVQVR